MKRLIGVLLTVTAGAAMAQEAAPSTVETTAEVGQGVRGWLDLQTSGTQAQTELRPVPGEVAAQVYQRYVNSFKTAIPEQMERQSFVGRGGSQ